MHVSLYFLLNILLEIIFKNKNSLDLLHTFVFLILIKWHILRKKNCSLQNG